MLFLDYSWNTSFFFFFVISLDGLSYVLVHNVAYKQSATGRLQNWMAFICCWSFVFPAPLIPQAHAVAFLLTGQYNIGLNLSFLQFSGKSILVLFFFTYNINLYQLLKISLSSVPSSTEQDIMTLISLIFFFLVWPFSTERKQE